MEASHRSSAETSTPGTKTPSELTKLRYEPPKLVVYGKIEAWTKSNLTGTHADALLLTS